jgi:hypothetical protein
MKTRLIFLVLLIVCFSCGTINKPLSDAEKVKIIGEVKEVVNSVIKAAEEVNGDMIISSFLDSPDFIFTYSGNSFDYKQFADLAKSIFGPLKNQKITVVNEKYAVLDNSTVMVTVINKCLMNYKDGHSVLQDPWISQFLFKKTGNKWKIVSEAESGVEKNVPGETSKELNQIELFKRFIGIWKADAGKDTTFIWEGKSYGDGLDVYVKNETKGKVIKEGKAIISYDKKSDKCVQARNMKGSGSMVGIMWFTSKNICEAIYLQDISNTENAASKWKFEFTSPDLFLQTVTENGKLISTTTFKKEKK